MCPIHVLLPPEQLLDLNSNAWTLFIDGSLTANGSGVGIVFRKPEGAVIEQVAWLEFKACNNEAEYEALIVGMQKVRKQWLDGNAFTVSL